MTSSHCGRRSIGDRAASRALAGRDPCPRATRASPARGSSPSTRSARPACRTGPWCRGRTGTAPCSRGRCSTRSVSGLPGGCSGYEISTSPPARQRRSSASATAIEQIRPPIDRPPSTSSPAAAAASASSRDRLRAAPAGGRAPGGRPCGTGSRRARSASGATARSMATQASSGAATSRRRGTAAAVHDGGFTTAGSRAPRRGRRSPCSADVLVAAVVGVDLAQPRRGNAPSPPSWSPWPVPSGKPSSVERPRPRVGHRRQRRAGAPARLAMNDGPIGPCQRIALCSTGTSAAAGLMLEPLDGVDRAEHLRQRAALRVAGRSGRCRPRPRAGAR